MYNQKKEKLKKTHLCLKLITLKKRLKMEKRFTFVNCKDFEIFGPVKQIQHLG